MSTSPTPFEISGNHAPVVVELVMPEQPDEELAWDDDPAKTRITN